MLNIEKPKIIKLNNKKLIKKQSLKKIDEQKIKNKTNENIVNGNRQSLIKNPLINGNDNFKKEIIVTPSPIKSLKKEVKKEKKRVIPPEFITVNLNVKGIMGLMYNNEIIVPVETTLLTLLSLTGLPYQQNENFITSLNGLSNEGMNGWTFTVNGNWVLTNANETIVKDGDIINWEYYVYKPEIKNEKDIISEMLTLKK